MKVDSYGYRLPGAGYRCDVNGKGHHFEANSWAFGFVDMVVKSTVFAEPESIISVVEDDWNDGPAASVAKLLAEHVRDGELHFIPVEEQH